MNKLEIDKIEFKNFMSYGNTWQTIDIKKGITVITGEDLNTSRSNGSGKSSLLETISFGFYGKTIKSVKKEKIVNWFNNSGCEVKLHTHKGNDTYLFHRGIKPNKFVVYKNGEKIPKLSSVKLYQSMIEEDVLGIDFKTFKELVYFSPNNSISLLEAKKEQKRQFIESLFDLKVYSEMNKKINEKTASIKQSIQLLENDNQNNQSLIKSHQQDIDNQTIPDDKKYKQNLNLLLMKKESLEENEIVFDENEYKTKEKKLNEFISLLNKDNDKINQIKLALKEEETKLSLIDIELLKNQRQELTKKLTSIDKKALKELLKQCINDKENCKERVLQLKKELENLLQTKETLSNHITSLQTKIDILTKELSNLSIDDSLTGQCPTCKQEVDKNVLKEWYDKEYERISNEISILKERLDKEGISLLKVTNDNITSKKEGIQKEKDNYKELLDKISDIEKKFEKYDNIKEQLDNLPDLEEKKKEIENIQDKIKKYKVSLDELVWHKEMLETDIENVQLDLNELKEKKQSYEKWIKDRELIELKIIDAKNYIIEVETFIKESKQFIKDKKESIKKIERTIKENLKRISSKNTLLDHLLFIKETLSDENIKQYAISSVIPYLNKRVNHYLTESGISYIIKIDGWLNVKIFALGAEEISYGSLSGGESKSINFAIQLACNDIAELQADTVLSISIFDEMIDSSLDDIGVQYLMNIIKEKQKLTNNSVFIITHRKELKDIEFDNKIEIIKENGFSRIGE